MVQLSQRPSGDTAAEIGHIMELIICIAIGAVVGLLIIGRIIFKR